MVSPPRPGPILVGVSSLHPIAPWSWSVGDGTAAALDRIGATAVTVHSALAPGVPLGAIVGGAAAGVCVVTKSGGFGDADSLIHIIDRLQSGAQHRKEPLMTSAHTNCPVLAVNS